MPRCKNTIKTDEVGSSKKKDMRHLLGMAKMSNTKYMVDDKRMIEWKIIVSTL